MDHFIIIKVQNDIILSMDRQEVALLVLIDLSAATEREILLKTRGKDFGVIGDKQKWLAFYLSYIKQRILIKNCISDAFNFGTRVPPESCLGPVLFLIYAAGLFKITDRHLSNAHTVTPTTIKSVFLFGRTHRRLRTLR